jgi:hypothetical protein
LWRRRSGSRSVKTCASLHPRESLQTNSSRRSRRIGEARWPVRYSAERSKRPSFASLPIGRIPGVGRVTESRLKEIRVTTVGLLQIIDQSLLEERFGRYGRRLYDSPRKTLASCGGRTDARFRSHSFAFAPKSEPLSNCRQTVRMTVKHDESTAVQEVPSIQ